MQLRFMHAAVVLSLLGGASGFAACSSSSSRSTTPKDGGADATADSDAAKPCTVNSECDDDDPCNGTETCDTSVGTCSPGASPCAAASDPVHCEVQCTNDGGQAKCGVEVARDSDGDGHGDNLCISGHGDDCDDTNNAIYPGATEACDGVDADCDGVADIDEGFSVSGTAFNVAAPAGADAGRPSAAWIKSAKKLGVVWTDHRTAFGNGFQVALSVFDETGAATVSDFQVSNNQFEATSASIATDGTNFGVAWVGEISGGRRVFLRLFDSSGVAKTGSVDLAGPVEPDAHVTIQGGTTGYIVSWRQRDTSANFVHVYARRVDSGGAPSGAAVSLRSSLEVYSPSAAAAGSEVGALYIMSGAAKQNMVVTLGRHDSQLAPLGVGNLTATVSSPSVFRDARLLAVPTGFAAIWSSTQVAAGSIHISELKSDGSTICGPTASQKHADDVHVGGIDLLGTTRLVAIYDTLQSNARVKLARFDDNCGEDPPVDVVGSNVNSFEAGAFQGSRADVAVGDSKVAVVWDEKPGANGVVKARIFGKNFCD